MTSVMRKCHNGKMALRSKLWVEISGEPVLGRGRIMLLAAIDKHGSINQASKEISISYKKAWSYIASMEERLGVSLVERQAGGRNGGGASLTPEARTLILEYGRLEDRIREFADREFQGLIQAKDKGERHV